MANEFGTDLAVIGKRNLDPMAQGIVTGKYDFCGDHFPGKLFGRTMGSPHAHAKIKSIDTSAAEKLPGVKAVITADDHKAWSKTIMCWGQEVAAVAAVDEATAERAIDLIKVDYEVLPFLIDAEAAMKAGAINVGTFADSNIQPTPSVTTRGDTAKGFAEADVIVEDTTPGFLRRHGMNHIEPESSLAWWEGGDCYLYDSNQSLFGNFRTLCSHIGMPYNKVHMIAHGQGGSWGGRGMTSEFTTAALLSKKAGGLPVYVQRSRRLQEPSRRNQYEPKLWMKMGCKKDGTMTAVEGKWWGEGGRTGAAGSYDLGDATWNTPNYYTETRAVATNTGPGAGYR
jgi:CO/xanthine dehydrogenase Mo-binding subunit